MLSLWELTKTCVFSGNYISCFVNIIIYRHYRLMKIRCLYAQFLNRSFRSVQSIRNYLSGVKTLHKILEIEYSTSNMFQLNLLLRGIARSKQHVP